VLNSAIFGSQFEGDGDKVCSGIDKIRARPQRQWAAGVEGCVGADAEVVAGGGFRVS